MILSGNYDKNKINLKNILSDLYESNIIFKEINTYESNLEAIFTELTKK